MVYVTLREIQHWRPRPGIQGGPVLWGRVVQHLPSEVIFVTHSGTTTGWQFLTAVFSQLPKEPKDVIDEKELDVLQEDVLLRINLDTQEAYIYFWDMEVARKLELYPTIAVTYGG